MNLKERGLTVGDLLIILITIIASIFIINKFNDNNERSHLHVDSYQISRIKN